MNENIEQEYAYLWTTFDQGWALLKSPEMPGGYCVINRKGSFLLIESVEVNLAVCKRMEEALERQTHVSSRDRVLDQTTLANASSMADLSLRPALAKAVETADVTGKRSFEVYGGKDADQPPFGRVPKQAKLQLVDFTNGMELISPTLQASQRLGLGFIIPWN